MKSSLSLPYRCRNHYTLFSACDFCNANRSALMNELNEIDGSFSTLNENKFIDLILYGIDLTKTCYNYFSINVKRICVLFMCIFYFNVFQFFPYWDILYISYISSPGGYCCMFLGSVILFCVNNVLGKKMKEKSNLFTSLSLSSTAKIVR